MLFILNVFIFNYSSDIFYTGWGINQNVKIFSQIKVVVKLESLKELTASYKDEIRLNMNMVK